MVKMSYFVFMLVIVTQEMACFYFFARAPLFASQHNEVLTIQYLHSEMSFFKLIKVAEKWP